MKSLVADIHYWSLIKYTKHLKSNILQLEI